MADTKLGRDLPGEDPDTPLPVHPMTDFAGYGLDADDIENGYCDLPEAGNPDSRIGGIRASLVLSQEPDNLGSKGFLYRGRFGRDR